MLVKMTINMVIDQGLTDWFERLFDDVVLTECMKGNENLIHLLPEFIAENQLKISLMEVAVIESIRAGGWRIH